MYIRIVETQQPIYEERFRASSGNMILVIYQFHSKTLFSQSVYNKVKSVYFEEDTNREIQRKEWTPELIAFAAEREKTVKREPKSVRYSAFGKSFMAFFFIVIVVLGFLAVQSISSRKKEIAQESLLSITPKKGDLYYGYFNEFNNAGVSLRMGWAWLKVIETDGEFYQVSIDKSVKENPDLDSEPGADFENQTYKVSFEAAVKPSFKSSNHIFDFTAMKKK